MFGGMMPLSLFIFHIFFYNIHTFIQSHLPVAIRRGPSPSPHRFSAQWGKPALQQANALPTEPRRTIFRNITFRNLQMTGQKQEPLLGWHTVAVLPWYFCTLRLSKLVSY